MAAAETGAEGVEQTGEAGSAFLTYMGENWWKFVILAIFLVVLVKSVLYMRKRFPIVREFLVFLKERKLWWMTPIAIIFVLLALVIVTMEGGAIAPFIYALF